MDSTNGLDECYLETIEGTNSSFTCVACPLSRPMVANAIAKHNRSAHHRKFHKIWLEQEAARKVELSKPDAPELEPDPPSPDDQNQFPAYNPDLADVEPDHESLEDRRKRLLDSWTKDLSGLFRSPALSVNSDTEDSIHNSPHHTQHSESEKDDSEVSDEQELLDNDMDECDSGWDPFSNMEQMVGSLILGSTRTTRSLLDYERLHFFFSLLGANIPAYKTVQNHRRRLKKQFNFNVCKTLSPLENPCFGLTIKETLRQELSNPYVANFLEFIPELPDANSKIHRLSQSKKWREELEEDIRVQMVEQGNNHFYLYELVQLQSKKIVIPFYFYKYGNEVLAKCVNAVQKFVKVGRDSKIRTEFKAAPTFNSPSLSTINIKTFWRTFDQIELPDGQLMKSYCSKVMYSQKGDEFMEVPYLNAWRIKANS